MNIVICDNDKKFVGELLELIEKEFSENSLHATYQVFYSGIQFLKWYKQEVENKTSCTSIDFLFIDMEMPGLTGLDTLKKFREFDTNCIVIIISNYRSYILDSFEFEPFDFILKPLNNEKFNNTLKRGLEKHKRSSKKMIIYSDHKHIILSYNDIISIESKSKNIYIHSIYGDFKVVKKLSYFIEKLEPYGFLKTHKSFLINMDKVLYYEGNQFFLLNGYSADISYHRRSEIVKNFNNYILNQKL